MVIETQRLSFWGGTACSLLPNIPGDNILLTAVMATLGASISFITSMLLKWLANKCKPKKQH
jgi:hypothetical protein